MKRVEIIGNQELMANLEGKLWAKLPHLHYTILNVMTGKGRKGQARGDGVWPTINFYCVLFVENGEDVRILRDIIRILKYDNTVNALKAFISEGNIVELQEYSALPQQDSVHDTREETTVEETESGNGTTTAVHVDSDE